MEVKVYGKLLSIIAAQPRLLIYINNCKAGGVRLSGKQEQVGYRCTAIGLGVFSLHMQDLFVDRLFACRTEV
jgi:hypothetical protein